MQNDITVSLSVAKSLAEAGWEQETQAAYCKFMKPDLSEEVLRLCWKNEGEVFFDGLAAPTASEMIREIPVEKRTVEKEKLDDPDAWAELWIYLKENKLL
jgi:hypothetical protein